MPALPGTANGQEVTAMFSGEVIGDSNLSGVLAVKSAQGMEIRFSIAPEEK